MGLFGKKKKNDLKFSEYNLPKGKGKKGDKLLTAYDMMKYHTVEEETDTELFAICDMILSGKPVLANFDKIDIAAANRMLAFVSGVVYATNGEIYKISDRLFMFARKEEYEDGSLYQYIEDTK